MHMQIMTLAVAATVTIATPVWCQNAPPQSEEVTLAEHAIPEPVRDLFSRTLRN